MEAKKKNLYFDTGAFKGLFEDVTENSTFALVCNCLLQSSGIHSDEGLTLETSVFESFTVANLPYRPCG